ncbi:unnamed protein product, partial [Mesorhabditis belari]|uniref:Cadherin domain-containing protein n=1 Tax=Mesorhabditis belari TaxID=2138241 RepID=A0AAF3EI15_9BILA
MSPNQSLSKEKKRESINPVIEHAKSKLEVWQALVVIRVEDLNDNAPRFVRLSPEGKYSAVLDYQADPRNTHILQLQAQDNDEKTQFVYGIYGEDEDLFVVNATTGDLYLEKIVHDDQKKEYHLTGTVADGAHVSEIPITIYKLHPDWNLVQLTVEKGSNEVDVKLLVNLLNLTSLILEMHALVKEPFTGSDGQIDPTRTFVYVYGLESKTKKPIERNKLKGLLDRFSMALLTSETKVSSISYHLLLHPHHSHPSTFSFFSFASFFSSSPASFVVLLSTFVRGEKRKESARITCVHHHIPVHAVLAGRPCLIPCSSMRTSTRRAAQPTGDDRRTEAMNCLCSPILLGEYGGRENGAYDTNSDRISEGKSNPANRHSSGRDSA